MKVRTSGHWSKIETMKKIMQALTVLAVSMILIPSKSTGQSASAKKYESLMQMIEYAYVDSSDAEKLTEKAIRSVLQDLDPHSVYIPREELEKVNEPLVGKFEGVGIQFNVLDDTIMVTNTISGGPSEKLGIMPGDRIVGIEGENVGGIGIKNSDVVKKLRGKKGTKVKVDILRRGESELLDFEITRDKIPIYSVDASYMAGEDVGYIKISRFANSTVNEFVKALTELKAQGAEKLILDLSNNGGGYLNRAIEMADEFLSNDKLIVYTEGRANPRRDSKATKSGNFEKGKLVVLINESSASASEIVAGAVQDWDRGLVIGRRSFGKGLVQKPYPLADGSAVRLTIARYHTPSGRCIQKPYEKGSKDYRDDLNVRYSSGELYSLDSIKFDEELKYFTSNKRLVYGGGGITPDIFVPLDTMSNSNYYRDLLRKGVLNSYTLSYVDNRRAELNEKYKDVSAFAENFKTDEALINDFYDYAEKKGVEKNEEQIEKSKELIEVQLRALIARNIWDSSAYFQIFNSINPFFNKAMEALNDDSFQLNRIAEN